jgi:hypothetical protein
MHMHTYQIKQNVILLGTNFESYNVILFGTEGGFILSQKGMIFFKKNTWHHVWTDAIAFCEETILAIIKLIWLYLLAHYIRFINILF